jgi:hypothetical protein
LEGYIEARIMKGFFGIGQVLMIAAVIVFFGTSMLSATQSGLSCGVSGLKDCNDFVHVVGGAFLSPSQRLSDAVAQLKSLPAAGTSTGGNTTASQADVMVNGYKGYLKDQIVSNVIVMFLLIYFIYWLMKKVVRSTEWDTMKMFAFIIITVALVGILQFAYGELVLHQFIVPYKGIYDLLTNLSVITA